MAIIGITRLYNPNIGAEEIWNAYCARAEITAVSMANRGFSIQAITGTMMIPTVMNPVPPMKAVKGKNDVTTYNADNVAARVSSFVLIFWFISFKLPTPGFILNAERVGASTHPRHTEQVCSRS